MAGMSMPRLLRTFLFPAPLLCGLVLLSGCGDDRYPSDMVFPARSDAIVLEPPKADAKGFDRPGELPKLIHELRASGGKVLAMDVGQDREQLKKMQAESANQEKVAELEKRINDWPKLHAQLDEQLSKVFGTPAQPTVDVASNGSDDEFPKIREALRLDNETLAKGSALYRRHCLHCHGVSGDGRGPTAAWVNPHPRDYRAGVFKFVSSSAGKPLRADLLRTLRQGVEGTSMPTFALLEDEELQALASTVIHLSLRGETEIGTIRAIRGIDPSAVDTLDDGSVNVAGDVPERVRILADRWQKADAAEIKPDQYPFDDAKSGALQESVGRGHRMIKEIGCLSCHIDYGRKDKFIYDKWGTVVRPANLTGGVYRGGRRPADLYWRIHAGIDPAQMPSGTNALKGKQSWDLINFLKALPYPDMLPPDVRKEIYGN